MTMLNLTLFFGLIFNFLKTQDLTEKTFKLIRALSGLLFSIGLILALFKPENEFNQFVISTLIVMNCLSIEYNKKIDLVITKSTSYLSMAMIILLLIINN